MSKYTKNVQAYRERSAAGELDYQTIHRMAYLLLVDDLSIEDAAIELMIEEELVQEVRYGKLQNALWIEAIVDLARKGLIDG